MGETKPSMVGTGLGDRRHSMEGAGQEALETLHREATAGKTRDPQSGQSAEWGHSMEGAEQT